MSRLALFGGAISAAKSLLQKLDVGTNQGVCSQRPSVSRDKARTSAGGSGADNCVVNSPATDACLNQSTNRCQVASSVEDQRLVRKCMEEHLLSLRWAQGPLARQPREH